MKYTPAIAVFMICFFIHFIFITKSVNYDESKYFAEGWLMSHRGYLVYSHIDNKMPLNYLIPQLLAMFFSGIELLLYSRLVATLFYSFLALLVCLVVDEWFGKYIGVFSGLIFALFSASDYTFGYTYLTYVMLAQFALFYYLTKKRFFWAGVFFGMGVWFMQIMIFSIPLVLCRLLWSDRKFNDLVYFISGFLAFSLIGLVWSYFFVDFHMAWFGIVYYNFIPLMFPTSYVINKIVLIIDTFNKNLPIYFIVLCSTIALIYHGVISKDWIKIGLVLWISTLFFMILMLDHIWFYYANYFYIPCALIFGWFVSVVRDDNSFVVIILLVFYVLFCGYLHDAINSIYDISHYILHEDLANALELQKFNCNSIYIIGNAEQQYALSGISPPQSEIDRPSGLFLDTGYLFDVRKNIIPNDGFVAFNTSELDRMFNYTSCILITTSVSYIVNDSDIARSLHNNGFNQSYNLTYEGYALWKK
jgi:hypothetical protein